MGEAHRKEGCSVEAMADERRSSVPRPAVGGDDTPGRRPEAQRTAAADGLRGGGRLAQLSLAASLLCLAVLLLDPMWWNRAALTRSAETAGALELSTVAF